MYDHTPGPLEVRIAPNTNGQEVEVDAPEGDHRLGHTQWTGLATFYGSDMNPEAGAEAALGNAQLFAAAGDLLIAADLLLHYCKPIQKYASQVEAFERLRAAVKKARGYE